MTVGLKAQERRAGSNYSPDKCSMAFYVQKLLDHETLILFSLKEQGSVSIASLKYLQLSDDLFP